MSAGGLAHCGARLERACVGHADHTFKDALTAVTTLRVRQPLVDILVHTSLR